MTTIDIAAKRAEAAAIAARRTDAILPSDEAVAAAKAAHPANQPKCPPHAALLHRIAATISTEDLPPARIAINTGSVDVDLTGTLLIENGVRRYAAAIGVPVTESPFDVDGFAATRWTAAGWLDGCWWTVRGHELLPTPTCNDCGRRTGEWPARNCAAPEEHTGATYDCDCGETVTVEQAIAHPTRHRRCNLIGARS